MASVGCSDKCPKIISLAEGIFVYLRYLQLIILYSSTALYFDDWKRDPSDECRARGAVEDFKVM